MTLRYSINGDTTEPTWDGREGGLLRRIPGAYSKLGGKNAVFRYIRKCPRVLISYAKLDHRLYSS